MLEVVIFILGIQDLVIMTCLPFARREFGFQPGERLPNKKDCRY
jgi:hypothetical protein